MATATERCALSADDVKAIKQCDRAYISVYQGSAAIKCVKDRNESGPFAASAEEYYVNGPDADVVDYDREYIHGDIGDYHCSASITRYNHGINGDVWETFASNVRVGDSLRLAWFRSNNSDAMREAGVVRDDLYIVIIRGKRRLRFYLDSYVGPGTSSARMIRKR